MTFSYLDNKHSILYYNTMVVRSTALLEHHKEQKAGETSDDILFKAQAAIEFAQQAERLGQHRRHQEDDTTGSTQAIEAHFVTPQDPVIQTAGDGRLPAVPVEEALKLNKLRDILEDRDTLQKEPGKGKLRESKDGTIHGTSPKTDEQKRKGQSDTPLEMLRRRGEPTLFSHLCLCTDHQMC